MSAHRLFSGLVFLLAASLVSLWTATLSIDDASERPVTALGTAAVDDQLLTLTLPDASHVSQTFARPLFRKDRRPFVVATNPPVMEEPEPMLVVAEAPREIVPPPNLALRGVNLDQNADTVLIADLDRQSYGWLKIGDVIAGWTLTSIEPDRATLTIADQEPGSAEPRKLILELYPVGKIVADDNEEDLDDGPL